MDMSLSKLQEMVKDREAWQAGLKELDMTEGQQHIRSAFPLQKIQILHSGTSLKAGWGQVLSLSAVKAPCPGK